MQVQGASVEAPQVVAAALDVANIGYGVDVGAGVLDDNDDAAGHCLTRRHRSRLSCGDSCHSSFGLWRVCFPPCLVRPGRRLPVQGLSRRKGVLVAVTGQVTQG